MTLESLVDVPAWEWPQNIGEQFLTILRDPSAKPSERLLAAEFAGDLVVMNDLLAEALLAVMGNSAETEELRARAAASLGAVLEECDIEEFDDLESASISEHVFEKIKAVLHRAFDDTGVPKLVRRRILEASVRAVEDWHADAIRTAYGSGDPEWVLTAVFGMSYVKGFDDEIIAALESPDFYTHYEAVRAAGRRELEAAWPHVSALAAREEGEKGLRMAAIEALATIRPKEAIPLLGDLMESEDEDISEAAEEALSMAQMQHEDELDDEFHEDEEFEGDEGEGGGTTH